MEDAGFFEDEAALFLFDGREAVVFFGRADRAEGSTTIFGFFGADLCPRSWSGSSFI